jgi:Phage protein Gp138 N-terminal domain
VKVIAVHISNDAGPVGSVDVQPLINQVFGVGGVGKETPIEHTIIYDVPYLRLQGGVNAVICDPQIGDLGLVVFADQDISATQKSFDVSTPPTKRKHDYADAIFVSVWNPQISPENYVLLNDDKIKVLFGSSEAVFDSTGISLTGAVTITGTLRVTDTVTCDKDLIANGTHVHTHTHGGVSTGTAHTLQPD